MKSLKIALVVFVLLGCLNINAQSKAKTSNQPDSLIIYSEVDVEGSYIDGEEELSKFVRDRFKMPEKAEQMSVSGMVFIQFIAETDGTINDIIVIAPKERQLGYGLEEECMRVIKLTSGNWNPATRAGKPVRSYWRFPFEVE